MSPKTPFPMCCDMLCRHHVAAHRFSLFFSEGLKEELADEEHWVIL